MREQTKYDVTHGQFAVFFSYGAVAPFLGDEKIDIFERRMDNTMQVFLKD